MSKVRINDLARELEVKSRAILDVLEAVGVTEKKTHSSSLEEDEAERVRAYLQRGRSASAGSSRAEAAPKPKIDLSRVSKPGDVLKAILQKKEQEAAAAARPRPAPPLPLRPSRPPRPQARPRLYPLCPLPRRKPQNRPRAGLFRSHGPRHPSSASRRKRRLLPPSLPPVRW